jgi:hypothetical protein
MDDWDEYLEEENRTNRIRTLVDNPNLVLFFVKGKDVHGAPEDSRVIFARMKSKGDEDGEAWKKDADFLAVNLSACIRGNTSRTLLGKKDLAKMKVIDKEKAFKLLSKMPQQKSDKPNVISIIAQEEEGRK